ncbi:tryptophan--tRNA ligase [Bacteroidota bacterium]
MSKQSTVKKKRVFSGIQPSGYLHLGNYLGAIKWWVARQGEKENIYCIVDMHAITVPQNPKELHQRTLETYATNVACGLDPEEGIIFVQSHVRGHAELTWLLNCVTPIGWLEKMTQFKDKSKKQESIGTGLLDYPVLMAADILLYDAEEVPVGHDQKQHVELARNIAQRFNNIYGDTFVVPEPVIPTAGARVRALNDPTKKMSKSDSGVKGQAVGIVDEPDEIRKAFKRAVTDAGREIIFSELPEKAGVNNLLEMYELLTGHTRDEITNHFQDKGYGDLKKEVAEVVIESLAPIREKYNILISDKAELDKLLKLGAEKAREIAEPKIKKVKEIVGFVSG